MLDALTVGLTADYGAADVLSTTASIRRLQWMEASMFNMSQTQLTGSLLGAACVISHYAACCCTLYADWAPTHVTTSPQGDIAQW